MFTTVNHLAFPRVDAIVDEMAACSQGTMRIANREKDDNSSFDDEAGRFVKIGEKRVGHDMGYYTQLGKFRPLEAFQLVLKEIVIPAGQVSPTAYEKGLDALNLQSEFLGEGKTEFQQSLAWLKGPCF